MPEKRKPKPPPLDCDDPDAWEEYFRAAGMPATPRRGIGSEVHIKVSTGERRIFPIVSFHGIEVAQRNHAPTSGGREGLEPWPGQGAAVDAARRLRPVEEVEVEEEPH